MLLLRNAARAAALLAGLSALMLTAGCESTGPDISDKLAAVQIGHVGVYRSATVAATSLPAGLTHSLGAILPKCAKGNVPHDVNVEILSYRADRSAVPPGKRDGATMTAMISFRNRATGEVLGPFRVQESAIGTSIAGPASASPEYALSNLFAARVCREVFGVRLTEDDL